MAIEKRFIHFKRFSDFNSKKLSANEANTQYTVGVSGAIQNGAPDILYQSYVWIKDTKQQWTHGQLYDGTNLNEAGFLAGEETSDQLDDVETHTYVKYVPQTLTDEQKAQTRINIDAISGSSLKTINGESIVGIGDITIAGGSSGGGGVETISLSGGFGTPLIIEEMLAEKRYYLYVDGGMDGDDQSIDILGFEGDGVNDGTHIRHFYAVIECVSMMGDTFNVSLSLPDVGIRWSTGVPIPIRGDGLYELSITQVIESGYAYYNGVLTSFSSL